MSRLFRFPQPVDSWLTPKHRAAYLATQGRRCVVGFAALVFSVSAFAQDEPSQGNTGTEEGARQGDASRVRPLRSGFRLLEDRVFGVGGYGETLQGRTKKRFSASEPGALFSYDQNIRGPWSGGLQLRLGAWTVRDGILNSEGEGVSDTAPVLLFSRIHFSPRLPFLWGETADSIVRPFAVGGLGYVYFVRERPSFRKSADESPEAAVTFGGGVRLVWPRQVALRLSVERWRGVKTARYSGMTYQCEVQFGDVDSL